MSLFADAGQGWTPWHTQFSSCTRAHISALPSSCKHHVSHPTPTPPHPTAPRQRVTGAAVDPPVGPLPAFRGRLLLDPRPRLGQHASCRGGAVCGWGRGGRKAGFICCCSAPVLLPARLRLLANVLAHARAHACLAMQLSMRFLACQRAHGNRCRPAPCFQSGPGVQPSLLRRRCGYARSAWCCQHALMVLHVQLLTLGHALLLLRCRLHHHCRAPLHSNAWRIPPTRQAQQTVLVAPQKSMHPTCAVMATFFTPSGISKAGVASIPFIGLFAVALQVTARSPLQPPAARLVQVAVPACLCKCASAPLAARVWPSKLDSSLPQPSLRRPAQLPDPAHCTPACRSCSLCSAAAAGAAATSTLFPSNSLSCLRPACRSFLRSSSLWSAAAAATAATSTCCAATRCRPLLSARWIAGGDYTGDRRVAAVLLRRGWQVLEGGIASPTGPPAATATDALAANPPLHTTQVPPAGHSA